MNHLNDYHYHTIQLIYIYYINILINYYNDIQYNSLKDTYYENVDRFFLKLLHYIINLRNINTDIQYKEIINSLIIKIKNGDYNINPDMTTIIRMFPSDLQNKNISESCK